MIQFKRSLHHLLNALLSLLFAIVLPAILFSGCGPSESLSATFQYTQTEACTMTTIYVTNVTPDADSYTWKIDGKFYSAEMFPQLVFTTEGQHLIELIVTKKGDSKSTTRPIFVGRCATVSFYMSKASFSRPVNVSLNSSNLQLLKGVDNPESCTSPDLAVFKFNLNSPSLTLNYFATENFPGNRSWSGFVTVSENGCEMVQLQ